ncbi:MAG: hypothetical protein Q4P15_12970, partial [Propionibacteriaceae bacterium]|nr:hypothetical protein [Propionibacteriaceae bacterium]
TATSTTTVTTTVTPTVKPTVAPSTPGGFDVYTTPGFHTVNGRNWHTTCEPYSQTTRCRTDIWGTTVSEVKGQFVQTNGWSFNNLTYLPSPKSMWEGNPLAETNTWVATDGRTWRTECNTAVTGGNGCRSYIWGQAIAAVPSASGTTYQWKWDWRFNNIVHFS